MEKIIYDRQRDLQDRHWWFKGRKEIIRAVLSRLIGKKGNRILDIGSGSGGMIGVISPFGRIDAVEKNRALNRDLIRSGVTKIHNYEMPRRLPSGTYDIVTMFDVLEHIKKDGDFLKTVSRKLLKKNGLLVVTVPAYQSLYSSHDRLSRHFRRYTRHALEHLMKEAGFTIRKSTYYMTLLFPLALLSRLRMILFKSGKTDLFLPNRFVNRLLFGIFLMEKHLLKLMNLPFGLSLLVIGSKTPSR